MRCGRSGEGSSLDCVMLLRAGVWDPLSGPVRPYLPLSLGDVEYVGPLTESEMGSAQPLPEGDVCLCSGL